jgi:hypothetical protein
MLLQHPVDGPRHDRHFAPHPCFARCTAGRIPMQAATFLSRKGMLKASETIERKSRLGELRPPSTKLR